MSKYREKLDRIQSKLLSGDVNARGRNSVNKQEYDRYDRCNADIVSGFCKSIKFPQYKFLEPSYMIFSLENQRSLCYKINGMIEKPLAITSDLDHEYYWVNYTVPMINKKYCEMRSNFNGVLDHWISLDKKLSFIVEEEIFLLLCLVWKIQLGTFYCSISHLVGK